MPAGYSHNLDELKHLCVALVAKYPPAIIRQLDIVNAI